MPAVILDGASRAKDLAKKHKAVTNRLIERNIRPKLVVFTVGDDSASMVYVSQKEKRAQEIGLDFEWLAYPENTSQEELINKIQEKNQDQSVHGIIVQLPLPKHLNEDEVTQKVAPTKDVDGFHPTNLGKLITGKTDAIPCTPKGIVDLLDCYDISVEGRQVVVVGRSQIVGFPTAILLTHLNATVTLCHSYTPDLSKITQQADILISDVGQANLIKQTDLKEGVVVVDVGMNRLESGKLVGDVDYTGAKKVASAITPVPGGVGPMTVAMVVERTLECCCDLNNIDYQALVKELSNEPKH